MASGGINKVILIGRLGKDPELRYTPSGASVANFPLATSEQWTDRNTGEKRERTEWHRISAWGKTAEICGEYLTKGKQVYVEGRLQTRSWEDQQGVKRYSTEVVAQIVQMLGSAPGGGQKSGYGAGPASDSYGGQRGGPPPAADPYGDSRPRPAPEPDRYGGQAPDGMPPDDDVPF